MSGLTHLAVMYLGIDFNWRCGGQDPHSCGQAVGLVSASFRRKLTGLGVSCITKLLRTLFGENCTTIELGGVEVEQLGGVMEQCVRTCSGDILS